MQEAYELASDRKKMFDEATDTPTPGKRTVIAEMGIAEIIEVATQAPSLANEVPNGQPQTPDEMATCPCAHGVHCPAEGCVPAPQREQLEFCINVPFGKSCVSSELEGHGVQRYELEENPLPQAIHPRPSLDVAIPTGHAAHDIFIPSLLEGA
jgi:hypothetical protein